MIETMGARRGAALVGLLVCCGLIAAGCSYYSRKGYRGHSETDEKEAVSRRVYLLTLTAPGFELPKSQPSIYVILPPNPTIMDQKLHALMKQIVVNQGGLVATDPEKSDLAVAVFNGRAERLETWTESLKVSTRSKTLAFRGGSWGVASSRTETTVPVERSATRKLTTLAINLFQFLPGQGAAGAKLSPAWRGEIHLDEEWFYSGPEWHLNLLFERLGSKDHAGDVNW